MTPPDSPHQPLVAGMYDFYLGGTANTAADRAAARKIMRVMPELTDGAWANRGFLQRAVKRMAEEWGVRQFIDLGAGLPTQRHTHEVAGRDSKVVYVDLDPRVIARGKSIVAELPNVIAIQADLRRPEDVLGSAAVQELIDFTEPVAVLLIAVLQFVPDADDPWGIVKRYVDAVPSGSYLAMSVITGDRMAGRKVDRAVEVYAQTPTPAVARTRGEIQQFFTDLDIAPPYEGAAADLCYVGVWGAEDPLLADTDGSRWFYAAVARKP